MAEADATEAATIQRESQVTEASARQKADAAESAMEKAREQALRDVVSGRENAMAGAAVLLALAVLGLGAGGLFYTQGKERKASWFIGGGGALMFGALALFVMRPSFVDMDAQLQAPIEGGVTSNGAFAWAGDNICRIDPARSRITVSQPVDQPFNWQEGGCVNGDAQYLELGTGWQRIDVPPTGHYVTMNRFDPATGTLRIQRWLPDGETMDKVRALVTAGGVGGCSTDPARRTALATLQSDISAILPAQPNERLVHHCQKGRLTPVAAAD